MSTIWCLQCLRPWRGCKIVPRRQTPSIILIFFQGIGSLFSALKVVRLLRLGRVVRKLDRWIIFSNDRRIVIIIAIILIIIIHINVNISNGWYLQISGVRSSNVDIAPLFLSTRGSLAGLHILLDWSDPPPSFSIRLWNSKLSGNSDLHNGVEFGWLYTLSVTSRQPYSYEIQHTEDNRTIYKIEVKCLQHWG